MARTESVQSVAIAVTAAGAGSTLLVAAPAAGKRIRVLGYVLTVSAVGMNPKFQSGANDKTGALLLPVNGGAVVPAVHPDLNAGWFDCNAGEALNVNVAAAGTVAGHLVYQVV